MKKLLSLVLSFAMVICYNITAFATPGTGSITIKSSQSLEGKEFIAYEVLKATLNDAQDKASYTIEESFEAFFEGKLGEEETVADYVSGRESDIDVFASELITYIEEQIKAQNTAFTEQLLTTGIIVEDLNEVTLETPSHGYYIVLDRVTEEKDGVTEYAYRTAAILTTSTDKPNNIITLKGSQPEVDKEIYHNDEGTEGNTNPYEDDKGWGPVGDNQIGDEVFYRLFATLPENITGYTNYQYILHDRMDDGLTFNNNIVVKDSNGGVIDPEYYTINSPGEMKDEDGNILKTTFSLTINVMDLYKDKEGSEGEVLTVEYSAILNDNAIVYPEGSNDNTVNLEYSNNPYDETSTETTKDVVVKDYTFELEVTKTDELGNTLEGVEFELSIKDGVYPVTFLEPAVGTNVYKVDENGSVTTIQTGTDGKFKIVGLDDKITYILTETKPLDGFNNIKPIEFTITAEYEGYEGKTHEGGTIEVSTGDDDFGLSSTIVNTTGALLPETGGIGTTIFTVAGGALMIGSVAVMISKRRSSK